MKPSIIACLFILVVSAASADAQATRPAYMPDPQLTPGDVLALTKEDVRGHGRKILPGGIPMGLKRQVFDRYGIKADAPEGLQVDRLIPADLGGSNSLQNLWPQPLTGEWSAMLKNRLEKRLHKLVCKGALDLKAAQQEIATDWVAAYKKYVGGKNQQTSRR